MRCWQRRRTVEPLRDQAVLMRTGHHSDLLEVELTARGVPFVKFGGLKFLEAAHVKDFVAAVRLLDNQLDEVAWYRLLRLHDGIGPARARMLLELLGAADGLEHPPRYRTPLVSRLQHRADRHPRAGRRGGTGHCQDGPGAHPGRPGEGPGTAHHRGSGGRLSCAASAAADRPVRRRGGPDRRPGPAGRRGGQRTRPGRVRRRTHPRPAGINR